MNKKESFIEKYTKLLIGILCVLLVVILFYIGVLVKEINEQNKIVEEIIANLPEVEEIVYEDLGIFSKEDYENYYAINNDYIGQVIFESGIINEPVLYSSTPSYYLRRNINKDYSIQGSVYLDDRNSTYDQNLIVYGHYTEPGFTDYEGYDPDVRPMFSNLELLLKQENYEENKTVYLFLKDEVITYEVASVYYCPLIIDEETNEYVYVTDGYEYYLTDYTDEEFSNYKTTILEAQEYNTDVHFTNYDKYLTLQTCVYAREDLREIVLCKEVSRAKY